MVRFFPVYNAFMPDGRHAYHEGYEAVVQAETNGSMGQDHVYSEYSVMCRKSHQAHPFGIFYGDNPLHYSFTLVMFEIVFVILTTRIIRFLLKPLKQPRVVCEIIGGIIIGPSILGRNKKFSQTMFPDNAAFVVNNIGHMGFMLFTFISGVKMDLSIAIKAGKKRWYTALIGVIVTMVTVFAVGILLRKSMDKELAKLSSIGFVAALLSLPSFPVLYPILKEIKLLSSEVGRMALTTAIVSDVIGINVVVVFEAAKQGDVNAKYVLWYIISTVVIVTFITTIVRRALTWIVEITPVGKPVDQSYVVAILLGAFMMGFLTDMCGIALCNGPLWLGLIIPDGPPLGATLVEKCEMIIMELFMPFAFAYLGLYTDVFAMSAAGWSSLAPLLAMSLTGYVSKIIGTLVPSLFFKIPVRDSLTLSLIMSLRGQIEFVLFTDWMAKKIVGIPGYTLLVLLTTAITGICTPLIRILYDPAKPYMVNKRRTIQHTPPNTELRMVLCIHDQESLTGLINLLEVSYPTLSSQFHVYALHVIELIGRAAPLLIDHEKLEEPSRYKFHDTIHHALQLYQETRGEFVQLHPFTVVAPKRTMYQDICELALVNKATLIILPFNKESLDNIAGTEIVRHGMQSLNSRVLDNAPCSVGILVEKGSCRNLRAGRSLRSSLHNFVVLFLGGADAREALAYADRMAGNPDVSLTVIRFLSHNYKGDDEMEKKLDDGVVTWFWVKNEANERVQYREVVVMNGDETVGAIQTMMNEGSYDLWITGRKQGINPELLEGLSNWNENHELGIIGDYVASGDFGSAASVLVIQQQILRGQEATGSSLFTKKI